jgi:protein SCO1
MRSAKPRRTSARGRLLAPLAAAVLVATTGIALVARAAVEPEPPSSSAASRAPSPDAHRLEVWPPHAESPDFVLTDSEGRSRTLRDYRGRVVVVFFGFAHCPDACPAELYKLALAMKPLGKLRERVQVLFITLDPERDTAAILKSYVAAFDSSFDALTGTAAQIDKAAASFYVEYARVQHGADYSIDHSTSTFVIDTNGRLRPVSTRKSTAADFTHDLRALALQTSRAGR